MCSCARHCAPPSSVPPFPRSSTTAAENRDERAGRWELPGADDILEIVLRRAGGAWSEERGERARAGACGLSFSTRRAKGTPRAGRDRAHIPAGARGFGEGGKQRQRQGRWSQPHRGRFVTSERGLTSHTARAGGGGGGQDMKEESQGVILCGALLLEPRGHVGTLRLPEAAQPSYQPRQSTVLLHNPSKRHQNPLARWHRQGPLAHIVTQALSGETGGIGGRREKQ